MNTTDLNFVATSNGGHEMECKWLPMNEMCLIWLNVFSDRIRSGPMQPQMSQKYGLCVYLDWLFQALLKGNNSNLYNYFTVINECVGIPAKSTFPLGISTEQTSGRIVQLWIVCHPSLSQARGCDTVRSKGVFPSCGWEKAHSGARVD